MNDDRITILYVYHGQSLGGAPLSLLYLIQRLDRALYRPLVLCLHNSDVVPHFRKHEIEVHVDPTLNDFQHTTAGWYPFYSLLGLLGLARTTILFLPSVWRTKALVEEYSPDVVHLNSLTLAPCALGVQLAGVPVVWHVREAVEKGHFGLRRRLLRWMVEKFSCEAIFICEDNRRRLGMQEKGEVIYNFVNFDRFDRSLPGRLIRAELGIPLEAKVILFLGGVSRIKGTLELVRAMTRIKQRIPDAIAVIAGSGEPDDGQAPRLARLASRVGYLRYSERVQRAVEQNGLDSAVCFLPFQRNVERLIATADVVTFPSTQPHFARPVIEAGAMAKPVVASRIGGVQEVVQHGVTGLLVSPGDVDALSTAIERVLLDPQLARSLGEAGYQQARRLFDARTNVRQTVAVYERVLERRGQRLMASQEESP